MGYLAAQFFDLATQGIEFRRVTWNRGVVHSVSCPSAGFVGDRSRVSSGGDFGLLLLQFARFIQPMRDNVSSPFGRKRDDESFLLERNQHGPQRGQVGD